MLRFLWACVAAAVVLALAGCGGSSQSGGEPGSVAELTSVTQLRDAFREDAGGARLVVLLSPT